MTVILNITFKIGDESFKINNELTDYDMGPFGNEFSNIDLRSLNLLNYAARVKNAGLERGKAKRRKVEHRARSGFLKYAEKLKELGLQVYAVTTTRNGKVHGVLSKKYLEEYTPNSESIYNTTKNIVEQRDEINPPNEGDTRLKQNLFARKMSKLFAQDESDDDVVMRDD